MKFDDALEQVGTLGPYQIIIYFMTSVTMFMSPDSLQMNFMAAVMPHWCQVEALQNFSFAEQQYIAIPTEAKDDPDYSSCYRFPLNFSEYSQEELIAWNRSEMTGGFGREDWVSCDGSWTYDRWQFVETINSKWDLVCGASWMSQLVGTIYMAGRLIGSVSAGIADNIGRRPATSIFNIIKLVGGVIASFVPYYPAFVIGRFMVGVGSIGGNLVCFVLLTEIVHAKHRSFMSFLWLLQFSFGYCVICGVGYFVRDYARIQMVFTFPMIFTLILIVSLDESPRWLMSQGRDAEAIKVLNKIATINRKPLLEITSFEETKEIKMEVDQNGDMEKDEDIEKVDETIKVKDDRKPNMGDLFKTPNMRVKTIIMYFDWFTTSLVYYGLSLNSGNLAGDLFLNTFLLGVVEIPAKCMAWLLLDAPALGRRTTLAGALLFGGLANLLCVPLFYVDRDVSAGLTTLAVLGKFGSTIAFSGVYVVAAELFPTTLRNVGVGSSSMCSRIANLATPYMGAPLKAVWEPLPSVIFGGMAAIAGSVTFLLPETLKTKLPETIEEAEEFGKGRFKQCCTCCGHGGQVSPTEDSVVMDHKPSNGTATKDEVANGHTEVTHVATISGSHVNNLHSNWRDQEA